MRMVDIIEKKRDGETLTKEEIHEVVERYVREEIPDYQMSALFMAVYFRGMTAEETRFLTGAMLNSGDRIDLSSLPGITVDKHSTGGVGDKVSLVLAPLAAAAGVPVPMMSGRGLGHTGGTLDKLEAIPGFRTDLGEKRFRQEVAEIGFGMIGQSERLVPADRKMYALRDVTGTVPSIPLICASIISKKKAEGADCLVLDVKTGSGAFLPRAEDTERLARELVRLGNDLSLRTVAQLTAMDDPLGLAVGNWLETREAVDCLRGEGPADVMEVTFRLGSLMLALAGISASLEEGEQRIDQVLRSGEGFERFCRMVEYQGGDVSVIRRPESYPAAAFSRDIKAEKDGFVSGVEARQTGLTAVLLGAGRSRKEDGVDPKAGIILKKKRGDTVKQGEVVATLCTSREDTLSEAGEILLGAYSFSNEAPTVPPVLGALIDPAGWVRGKSKF